MHAEWICQPVFLSKVIYNSNKQPYCKYLKMPFAQYVMIVLCTKCAIWLL